ncbi:MAG: phage holin family protein [Candidatus Dormibacteria bacterium]
MPNDGIGGSLAEIAADAQKLVKLELALAKQEITELVKRNAVAIGMLAGAALCGLFVLYTLVALIVFAILSLFFKRGMGHDAIALAVVLLIWGVAAAVLGLMGKSRLVFKMPEITIQTLKDDVEWAKTQIKPATR